MAESFAEKLAEIEAKLAHLETASSIKDSQVSSGTSPFQARVFTVPLTKERAQTGDSDQKFTQTSRVPGLDLPKFDGSDVGQWLRAFTRWLRLTGVGHQADSIQLDWCVAASTAKVQRIVERLAEEAQTFEGFATRLQQVFPRVENDFSIRALLAKLPQLGKEPAPAELEQLLVETEYLLSRLSPNAVEKR